MKRILPLILSLFLLCAVLPAASADAGLETIRSDVQAFSTRAPAGAIITLTDNGSIFVYLEDEGYVPNVWINRREAKLNDPIGYIHEKYPAYMKDTYGDNLVSVMTSEIYEIGGKQLPAAVFVYRGSSGNIINQVNLVEVRDDGDVEYQARYLNDEKEMTLEALDAAVRYYQPDGGQTAAPQGGSGAAAHSFTVTNIEQDKMIVGRCVAPAGYTVTSQAYCCTESQSAENPWLLVVDATAPDGTSLAYMSARNFYTDGSTTDGTFAMQFLTPVLHYMTAAEYCDYWALMLNDGAKVSLETRLRQQEQAWLSKVNNQVYGLSADRDSQTACARCYYVEDGSGQNWYFCTATFTHGTWYTATLPGPIIDISSSYVLWSTPYFYAMRCPEALWEANSDIFSVFMENTTVNDQFLLANQRLSTELLSMMTGINLVGGESYSRSVMKQETDTGNDYKDERFTDYLFDQNDYTLSDGSHVKISTAYDYVYEGDNGVVYYSNSAFSQPGGSTQLTPNR